MILYIPVPLLWNVQLPLPRKLLYGCWLCTGIFIMIATLLRCILCLQDVSQINVGTIWSIRETVCVLMSRNKSERIPDPVQFVGIIAVNLPVLKPFFGKAKHAISSAKSSKKQSSSSGNVLPDSHRLSHIDRFGKKRTVHALSNMTGASEEHMVGGFSSVVGSQADLTQNGQRPSSSSPRSTDEQDGIHITQSYEISHSSKKSIV